MAYVLGYNQPVADTPPESETLPIHCRVCGNPVTIQYRPMASLLQHDNEFVCPHCGAHVQIRLPGRLSDWWSGHRDSPIG